jgi:hypothetical protein
VKQLSFVLQGLAHGAFPGPSLEAFCQGGSTLPHYEVSGKIADDDTSHPCAAYFIFHNGKAR